jgi:hypothetical protein
VALEYRAKFQGTEGVLFVGKAQEKTTVFRTEKRRNRHTGQTYPWIVRSTAMVNQLEFIERDGKPPKSGIAAGEGVAGSVAKTATIGMLRDR